MCYIVIVQCDIIYSTAHIAKACTKKCTRNIHPAKFAAVYYITIGRDNRDVVEKEDDGQGRMNDVAADTMAVPN
jgi:hypothetical protein